MLNRYMSPGNDKFLEELTQLWGEINVLRSINLLILFCVILNIFYNCLPEQETYTCALFIGTVTEVLH